MIDSTARFSLIRKKEYYERERTLSFVKATRESVFNL